MIRIAIDYTSVETEQTQWDYVLSHFAVDEIYVYSPDAEHPRHSKVFKYAILITTAEDLPTVGKLVVMTPPNARHVVGDESLVNFTHPAGDVTYLFGPSNVHLSEDELGARVPDHKVYIPTVTHDQMYPWIACAITLYDRLVKTGG